MEVTNLLRLNEEERQKLDMHSMLNIINVLIHNLEILAKQHPESKSFQEALDLSGEFRSYIVNNNKEAFSNAAVGKYHKKLNALMQEARNNFAGDPLVSMRLDNIDNILTILDKRSDELLARWALPDLQLDISKSRLENDLKEFLKAIEINSGHAYRIVFNPTEKGSSDYFVNIAIHSNEPYIRMPLAIKDALFDLLANARKYTPRGGNISIHIEADRDMLQIEVADNGIGIPGGEMEKVLSFGGRGSNVEHMPTMGSGYGLTKTLSSVQRYGGRMWIESEKEKGTRIRIRIPLS